MLVAVDEGNSLEAPGGIARAEAHDLEELGVGLVRVHPNLVAQADIWHGDLLRVQEGAEPQALAHRLVKGV